MLNNQKIKKLEERLKYLEERDKSKDIKESNLKYNIKQNIITDLHFRNTLENNVASDVMMRLQDKESDTNLENLIKIQLNSMYGAFKNHNASYRPFENKIAMLCDIIQLAKKSTTFWSEKDDRITISYVVRGACMPYCFF